MSKDIAEFLLARIDEETTMAEFQRDWAARRYPEYKGIPDMDMDPDSVGRIQVGPARVLAECEAKRRIVAECTPWLVEPGDDYGTQALALMTLWILALPYAEHPDYQERWSI